MTRHKSPSLRHEVRELRAEVARLQAMLAARQPYVPEPTLPAPQPWFMRPRTPDFLATGANSCAQGTATFQGNSSLPRAGYELIPGALTAGCAPALAAGIITVVPANGGRS